MKQLTTYTALLCAIVLLAPGCVSAEELDGMKQTAAAATAESNSLKADYDALVVEYQDLVAAGEGDTAAAQKILLKLQDKSDLINTAIGVVNDTNTAIQDAKDSADLWANLALVGIGLIPGAGVMTPFVTLFRNRFRGTVAAVAAAGGPKDPLTASRAMDPALREAIRVERLKIGDTTDRSAAA